MLKELKVGKKAGVVITNRDSKSIEEYLAAISEIPLLSQPEELELAKRIALNNNDQDAVDKLVKANLRFVVSVAKQYQGVTGISLDDLINEGNLGLIKAARKFDHTRGFKFISYAVWWIRQRIMSAITEYGRITRIPENRKGDNFKVYTAENNFYSRNEREPTDEELAEILNMSVSDIEDAKRIPGRALSIDSPLTDNPSEGSFLDVMEDTNIRIPDDELAYGESLKVDIVRVLDKLSDRERQVIIQYFGLNGSNNGFPMVLEDIGEDLGITRERVRQIKDRALSKMKGQLETSRVLKEYLAVA